MSGIVLFLGWDQPDPKRRFGFYRWNEELMDEEEARHGVGLRLGYFYVSVGTFREMD